MIAIFRVLVCALLCTFVPVTQAAPLFADESNLQITIDAPMRAIIRNKRDREEYDAVLRFKDASGQDVELNARLSSRGNARLDVCDFPPLRLSVKKGDAAGTIFEGQKNLKMVTQCKTGNAGEKWLLQELGIYHAYNVLTDHSYRVRRLDVTYQDSESANWNRTQPAFFIESTGEMADRVGLDSVRPPKIEPNQFEQNALATNLLFQLLIANTDFSAKQGPAGEGCCHNGRVLTKPGAQGEWIVVPYDFDQAGIINTEYALPDRRLGIKRVTNRKYRGFCWQNESLPAAIDLFLERKEAIIAALTPADFSASREKRLRKYAEEFFDILEDPRELQEEIFDECRGPDAFPIRITTTP